MSHNALLTRWVAYQVATAVLTHEVGLRVSPEQARGFERSAAGGCSSPSAKVLPRKCDCGSWTNAKLGKYAHRG